MSVNAVSTLEKLLIVYARHFPIRRGKLRVINSLWRYVNGDRGTQRSATLVHGGFKMSCNLSEMLQRQYYFFGTYFVEQEILDCWKLYARDAKVVFDIGANAGIFSLAALAVQREATVHAFEPTPEIAARLRATSAINGLGNLNVNEAAIVKDDGWATLTRCRGDFGDNDGMNFVTAAEEGAGEERVRTISLDSFCAERDIDHIDLLKLDIQGNEHQALLGASHLLSSGRISTIFTELNWASEEGAACPATATIALLDEAGYHFAEPCQHLRWHPPGDWLRSLSDVVASRKPLGKDS
jgi:FkbM family methyltransferase